MTDEKTIPTNPEWSEQQEALITSPFDYLSQTSGKNLRAQLITLFNTVIRIPADKLEQISKIIEMLHTASLLIDDIQDGSELRRGKPAAHLVYGTPYVINSSNYMYFRALRETIALGDMRCIVAFDEELLNLHRGQSLDLYWRDNLCVPTEEEYYNMVMNKTGGLFRLAARLMECFSKEEVSLVPLANLFGIIYQVKDDYLNLRGETLHKNKGFCEDISEGKLSYPIIHSLRMTPHDRTLMGILRMKTKDDQIKQIALDMLEKTDSFGYTLEMLGQLRSKAHAMVDDLEKQMVQPLAEFHAVIDMLSAA